MVRITAAATVLRADLPYVRVRGGIGTCGEELLMLSPTGARWSLSASTPVLVQPVADNPNAPVPPAVEVSPSSLVPLPMCGTVGRGTTVTRTLRPHADEIAGIVLDIRCLPVYEGSAPRTEGGRLGGGAFAGAARCQCAGRGAESDRWYQVQLASTGKTVWWHQSPQALSESC